MTYALAPALDFALSLDHVEQQPQRYFGTPLAGGRIARELRDQNYNVGDADISFEDNKAVARLTWRINPALTINNELAYMKAHRNWRNAEYYFYDTQAKLVERSDYIAIQHIKGTDRQSPGSALERRRQSRSSGLGGGHH